MKSFRKITIVQMITPTIASSPANLLPGTLHWSSKVQVRGTDEEIVRLGGKVGNRLRNRERRPIYIVDKLRDDRLLVLTCTTRHNEGYAGIPTEFLSSFLPVEPDTTNVERPIIKVIDDQDKAFGGKTLIFLEVPIAGYMSFFVGYIATVTPASRLSVEADFYQWQHGRLAAQDPASALTAALSCIHAVSVGLKLKGSEQVTDRVSRILRAHRGRIPAHMSHLVETIDLYLGPNGELKPVIPIMINSPDRDAKAGTLRHTKSAPLTTRTNMDTTKTSMWRKRSRSVSPSRSAHHGYDEQSGKGSRVGSPSPRGQHHHHREQYVGYRYEESRRGRSRSPVRKRYHEDSSTRYPVAPAAQKRQAQDKDRTSSFHPRSPRPPRTLLQFPDSERRDNVKQHQPDSRNEKRGRPLGHHFVEDRSHKPRSDTYHPRAGDAHRSHRPRSPAAHYERRY